MNRFQDNQPSSSLPTRSFRLAGLGCALVVADESRVLVLDGDPVAGNAGYPRRTIPALVASLGAPLDLCTIAVLGPGDATCDFSVLPMPKRGYPPAIASSELAVACAVMARVTGRVLPEPVVKASTCPGSPALHLTPPQCWWRGDWKVRSRESGHVIAARLIFHGELVLE